MTLSGDIVCLRAIEPADADLLYQWENDETAWYLSNTITPFSRFVIDQYIMDSQLDIFTTKQLRLMIETTADKKTVGSIDLFDFDPHHQRAGIGIMIAKEFRNQQLASEALKLLIEYSFSTLNLHQLYCNILADNEISLQLFKKQHFEIIGNKRQWIKIKEQWMDEYLLQLIRK
jgi:diamine N-acetyltransferase